MVWRLLTDDGVAAASGLAADEVLARHVGVGLAPPTLRLYTYRPHAALVGRFQDTAQEIHMDFCRRHDIQVNRRPTGGGAILMGPDQLGVALALPGRRSDLGRRPRQLMERFSAGLVIGLSRLGITATFRGRNDLAVEGRKIAGLGIYRDRSGGLLFHASLLVGLDVGLMSRVLRTPEKRVSAEVLATIESRLATVRRLLARDLPLEEVRAHMASGFVDAFGVRLELSDLDAAERAAIAALEREKYQTSAWVFQRGEVTDTAGAARLETPAGLLEVRVALAGRMIKAVWIRGDFFDGDFADENAIADLEARLRWHSSEPDAVAEMVRKCVPLAGDSLLEAILSAVAAARDPYGCFVAPRPEARVRP